MKRNTFAFVLATLLTSCASSPEALQATSNAATPASSAQMAGQRGTVTAPVAATVSPQIASSLAQVSDEAASFVLKSSDADFTTRVKGFTGDVIVDDLKQLKQARKAVGPGGLVLLKLSNDAQFGLEALKLVPDRIRIFADAPETPADVEKIYDKKLPLDPSVLASFRAEESTLAHMCETTMMYRTWIELQKAGTLEKNTTIANQIQAAAQKPNHIIIVVAHVDGTGAARFRDGSKLDIAKLPKNVWTIGCDTVNYDAKQSGLRVVTIGKPDFLTGLRTAATVSKALLNTRDPNVSTPIRQGLLKLQDQKLHFAVGALGAAVYFGMVNDDGTQDEKQ